MVKKRKKIGASSDAGEYLVNCKMVFGLKVESMPSCLKDEDIRSLANTFGIDCRLRLMASLSSDRACWPRDGHVALNSMVFKMSIRLPLHSFF